MKNEKNNGKRVTIALTATAHARLRERSKQTGVKLTTLLDEAVFEFLKRPARVLRLAEREE